MATVATRREKNFSLRQRTKTHYEHKIPLTPTGLLMEGRYTQISTSFDSLHIEAFEVNTPSGTTLAPKAWMEKHPVLDCPSSSGQWHHWRSPCQR